DPASTAELIRDGWMHSGDLGVLEDGYLRIVGRKKDLLVTSTGKNIAPQDMETALHNHPFISQAVVVGDGRKYLTALTALDDSAVASRLQATQGRGGTEDLATHPAVQEEIAKAVAAVNPEPSRAEQIQAWRLPPRERTIAGGELTPTLKVKREVVLRRFPDLVEEMYAG